MRRRGWAAVPTVLLSLALSATASAQFTPGARSLGDPYYVNTGNGGYDAQHYDLTIDYDPVAHTMTSKTVATMRATQGLSEFSLDFVGYYAITSVKVNGVDATFTPDIDAAAYKHKLVITPAAGIANNATFTVEVAYNGTPQNFLDPDDSLEGFMRMRVTNGAFVMNEPVGAMGWFPNNNHPSDKATFDFHLTAPSTYVTAGNGELANKTVNADGKTTWDWHLGYPMASYLSTSTIGLFDYIEGTGATAVGATGQPLKTYSYIESDLPAATKAANTTSVARQDAIVKFIADTIGTPYPYLSHGVVAGRAPFGGTYALEVQTKSHFGSGNVGIGTLAHEIAHQWFGDSVGPATWREIWFNEGWATWWATYWSNKQNGSATTNLSSYYSTYFNPTANWSIPPAEVNGGEGLFDTMPVYTRPSMMLEGYHQLVGDAGFFAFAKALATEHAYGTITEAQFIALAKRIAAGRPGFGAVEVARLDEFFAQWLHGKTRPTLTHDTFFAVRSGSAGGTVPATLSLTMGPAASFGAFTPGIDKTYTASTTATVTSSAGDANLSVSDPGHLMNGTYALAEPLQIAFSKSSWAGPTSNESVPITFTQVIKRTDPLRSGTYSKTLTFTLSTTNP